MYIDFKLSCTNIERTIDELNAFSADIAIEILNWNELMLSSLSPTESTYNSLLHNINLCQRHKMTSDKYEDRF